MHRVYKFEPGVCTCILGDPGVGSHIASVSKLSGLDAVLDPSAGLKKDQYVYATVKLADGPSLALAGLVVTSAAGGILIQWMHSNPRDADKVDAVIAGYVRERDGAAAPIGGSAAPASAIPSAPTVSPAAHVKEKTEVIPGAGNAHASRKAGRRAKRARARTQIAETDAAPQAHRPAAASGTRDDGPLDVGARLRRKAKTIRSSDLASRLDTVQVVNMGEIHALVKEAVDESLALHGASLRDADRNRLLEEAEASFAERLKLHQSEKSGLEERVKTLEDSFRTAQRLLEEERAKVLTANQFTVSDAGMIELEQRLGRLMDRAIRTGEVSAQFEEEMRGVVLRLLDDERAKIREQAQQAQSDRIALLEKKVERLASSLQSAESERDLAREHAQALEAAGGLRNIMTAGLDAKDPRRERKLGLLREIYEMNKAIRADLIAAGRLSPAAEESRIASELGIQRSAAPAADSPPPPAPAGPEEGAEVAGAREKVEVPVLASGPDADPDDLPWEPPPGAAGGKKKSVKIRKPGRGR
jgi:hypothetical protein